MTSLVAWVGVDSRGPSSLYLASDSRITWDVAQVWDYGRKLYVAHNSPDLLGYCGDVVFPSLLLGQFVSLSDAACLVESHAGPPRRHEALLQLARTSLEGVPEPQRRAFSILHCAREGRGTASRFHVWCTEWTPTRSWLDVAVPMPAESSLLRALGSGKDGIDIHDLKWRKSDVGRTSRAVFSAFCDSLRSGSDPLSGGGPQLVGLYREGPAQTLGVLFAGQRYLLGLPLPFAPPQLEIEWRNELFERIDPDSTQPLHGAQRHARPTGLPL